MLRAHVAKQVLTYRFCANAPLSFDEKFVKLGLGLTNSS
jgi:hypothetical protein